jgi:hypothetical protein
MPALPLDDAGPYVAAAYLVFLALILVYLAIMASKLARISREVAQLSELAARRDDDPVDQPTAGGERPAGDAGAARRPAGGDERAAGEAVRR